MTHPGLVSTFGLVLLLATPGPVVFTDLKTAFNKSASDRELVVQDAELVLDPEARTLSVKSEEHPLNIKFDDIQKVVFDSSVRMRGGKLGRFIGGSIGVAVSAHHVTEGWCYLEAGQDYYLLQEPYMGGMKSGRACHNTRKSL